MIDCLRTCILKQPIIALILSMRINSSFKTSRPGNKILSSKICILKISLISSMHIHVYVHCFWLCRNMLWQYIQNSGNITLHTKSSFASILRHYIAGRLVFHLVNFSVKHLICSKMDIILFLCYHRNSKFK